MLDRGKESMETADGETDERGAESSVLMLFTPQDDFHNIVLEPYYFFHVLYNEPFGPMFDSMYARKQYRHVRISNSPDKLTHDDLRKHARLDLD
jgi:hypothetical protein